MDHAGLERAGRVPEQAHFVRPPPELGGPFSKRLRSGAVRAIFVRDPRPAALPSDREVVKPSSPTASPRIRPTPPPVDGAADRPHRPEPAGRAALGSDREHDREHGHRPDPESPTGESGAAPEPWPAPEPWTHPRQPEFDRPAPAHSLRWARPPLCRPGTAPDPLATSAASGPAGRPPTELGPDGLTVQVRRPFWIFSSFLMVFLWTSKPSEWLEAVGLEAGWLGRWLDVCAEHPLRSALALVLLGLAAQPLRGPPEPRLAAAEDCA